MLIPSITQGVDCGIEIWNQLSMTSPAWFLKVTKQNKAKRYKEKKKQIQGTESPLSYHRIKSSKH